MKTLYITGSTGIYRLPLLVAGERPMYVNTHAPSTPLGDAHELEALRAVFGERMPLFSSTKALTGHPLAASGVHEAIYTLLMMRDGFVAASAGIESLDACAEGAPLVRSARTETLATAMSVSFGFGGSCASLMFRAC